MDEIRAIPAVVRILRNQAERLRETTELLDKRLEPVLRARGGNQPKPELSQEHPTLALPHPALEADLLCIAEILQRVYEEFYSILDRLEL